jgi:hypothetical protein
VRLFRYKSLLLHDRGRAAWGSQPERYRHLTTRRVTHAARREPGRVPRSESDGLLLGDVVGDREQITPVQLRCQGVVLRLETQDHRLKIGDPTSKSLVLVKEARVASDIPKERLGHREIVLRGSDEVGNAHSRQISGAGLAPSCARVALLLQE